MKKEMRRSKPHYVKAAKEENGGKAMITEVIAVNLPKC